MAASLFIPPSKALDANANPYAGAKWFFYATGTTTPQSVYTTFAMGTAHANPVVADSTGKFANIFFDPTLVYRGVLKDSTEAVTLHDIDPISSSTLAALAASGGSALVGFSHANTYANGTVGKDLDRVVYIENAPYNAVGDGVADDTAAWQAALNSGASAIITRPGANYKVTSLTPHHPNLQFIGADGVWKMTCTASLNSIGITLLAGAQFMRIRNMHLYSSGNGADGLSTIGLRSDSAVSLELDHCRYFGFSSRGFQIRQCVFAYINRPLGNCDAVTPCYGISFEKLAGVPCTTVIVNQPYLFGGTRAISGDGIVDLLLIQPIFELAGDTNATPSLGNGALHLITCRATVIGEYFEGCNRNKVYNDSVITTLAPGTGSSISGTFPDYKVYSAVGFNDQGQSILTDRKLTITEIVSDPVVNAGIKQTGAVGYNTFPTAGFDLHHAALPAGEWRSRYVAGANTFDFVVGAGGLLSSGEAGYIDSAANRLFTMQRISGATGAAVVVNGASTTLALNGTQVLTTRGSAITAPTGGATVDAEARTAINAIRAEMARHGLIA